MKRGFLSNRTLSIESSSTARSSSAQSRRGATAASTADNVWPPDVSVLGVAHTTGTLQLNAFLSQPGFVSLRSPRAFILTRVPSTHIDSRGTTECALDPETKQRLSSLATHPRTPVEEPLLKSYDIRPSESKGLGMFALQALDVGDLIIVERPLMVLPYMNHTEDPIMTPDELGSHLHFLAVNHRPGLFTHGIARVQAVLLQALLDRMNNENREAYKKLANAYSNNDHFYLLGRYRTNAFVIGDMGLGDGSRYDAVCRETSRINHSCRPNCGLSFDPSTFSVEVRATKAIAKDEEILLPYCLITSPTHERQAQLKNWKFTCTCTSCTNNPTHPSKDAIRISILSRLKDLEDNMPETLCRLYKPANCVTYILITDPQSRREPINQFREKVLVLLRDLMEEGLDGSRQYAKAMEFHALAISGQHFLTSAIKEPDDRDDLLREAKAEMDWAVRLMNRYNTAHYGSAYNGLEPDFVRLVREAKNIVFDKA